MHAGIYSVVVFLMAAAWEQGPWLIPVLFMSHLLIDGLKASLKSRTLLAFLGDQTAHLAVLAGIFLLLAESPPNLLNVFNDQFWRSPRPLVIILGYLLVIWPIGRFMSVITEPFRQQMDGELSRGLEQAGLWIGCLERVFLLTFVIFGYLPGAALLLGLKSLFRFGEIKDPANRKEAEYILIGTLLSFAFGLAVGLAVKQLLTVLP